MIWLANIMIVSQVVKFSIQYLNMDNLVGFSNHWMTQIGLLLGILIEIPQLVIQALSLIFFRIQIQLKASKEITKSIIKANRRRKRVEILYYLCLGILLILYISYFVVLDKQRICDKKEHVTQRKLAWIRWYLQAFLFRVLDAIVYIGFLRMNEHLRTFFIQLGDRSYPYKRIKVIFLLYMLLSINYGVIQFSE